MLVLTLRIKIHAPWCRSLKDKRSEIKKLLARLRAKFNVSASEIGAQDALCMIELGVAAIAAGGAQADSIAQNILNFVQSNTEGEILSVEQSLC
jgi:uncharacterized protein YlxP (DUF503 family)